MNYDIEFPNPFWLGIRIKETEDKLPSIGAEVDLKLDLPRGKFTYSATDMWFECAVLDEFLVQLKKLKIGQTSKAEFYDIDRELFLTITNEEIQLSIHRIHSEMGSGYMEFKKDFDAELIYQYITHIEAFAKWW